MVKRNTHENTRPHLLVLCSNSCLKSPTCETDPNKKIAEQIHNCHFRYCTHPPYVLFVYVIFDNIQTCRKLCVTHLRFSETMQRFSRVCHIRHLGLFLMNEKSCGGGQINAEIFFSSLFSRYSRVQIIRQGSEPAS